MDSLCNHKEFASRWADGEEPACTCDLLPPHVASQTATSSSHFFVEGDTLTFSSAPLTSIANSSLQNKIFPPNKEIFKSLQKAFDTWHRKKIVPSIPLRHITYCRSLASPQSAPPQTHHPQGHHVSNNPSRARCSTTRTNVLRLCGSFAHIYISNASRPPWRTPTSLDASTTRPNH